jgi:hypothetical protein
MNTFVKSANPDIGWRGQPLNRKIGATIQRFNDSTWFKKLQIGVTRAEHRGKARGLFLAAALFTRLFKMPMIAHDLQGPFAVNFFLQSPQRTFHWFAFFQSNFGQRNSLPFQGETKRTRAVLAKMDAEHSFSGAVVNAQKRAYGNLCKTGVAAPRQRAASLIS